jgi:hypothetical protein
MQGNMEHFQIAFDNFIQLINIYKSDEECLEKSKKPEEEGMQSESSFVNASKKTLVPRNITNTYSSRHCEESELTPSTTIGNTPQTSLNRRSRDTFKLDSIKEAKE